MASCIYFFHTNSSICLFFVNWTYLEITHFWYTITFHEIKKNMAAHPTNAIMFYKNPNEHIFMQRNNFVLCNCFLSILLQ